MYMRFPGGVQRAVTLSYDDGVIYDEKLMEIMDKYGIKGTFNLNSGLYPDENITERTDVRLKLSEAKALFTDCGHEVAIHSLNHPYLAQLDASEVVYEITEDRRSIEREFKALARGMAYAHGSYNDAVLEILKYCGICYARTVKSTNKFDMPENWLTWHPTCHHKHPRLMALIDEFFAENTWNRCSMFCLWGHSYEFRDDKWYIIEDFCRKIGGRADVWYATNIEIYDYVKAYESLQTSYDKHILHNPTELDIWVYLKGETLKIKAGETLYL